MESCRRVDEREYITTGSGLTKQLRTKKHIVEILSDILDDQARLENLYKGAQLKYQAYGYSNIQLQRNEDRETQNNATNGEQTTNKEWYFNGEKIQQMRELPEGIAEKNCTERQFCNQVVQADKKSASKLTESSFAKTNKY